MATRAYEDKGIAWGFHEIGEGDVLVRAAHEVKSMAGGSDDGFSTIRDAHHDVRCLAVDFYKGGTIVRTFPNGSVVAKESH